MIFNQSFDRKVTENIVKKLRRFAISLSGDQQLADEKLLDVITRNKKLLRNDRYNDFNYIELLIATYQSIGSHNIARYNMNPPRTDGNPENSDIFERFQSLHYLERAVIYLHMVEQLSPETIARMINICTYQVQSVIDEASDILSHDHYRLCLVAQ